IYTCLRAFVRGRRAVTLTDRMKSPFYVRVVNADKVENSEEKQLANFLFNKRDGDDNDVMFKTKYGHQSSRGQIETLGPQEPVDDNVLSSWSAYLNFMEEKKDSISPAILFFPTFEVDTKLFAGDNAYTLEMFMEYAENANSSYGGPTMLEKADIVFIPVSNDQQKFLVCVNLKNPAVTFIDSKKEGNKVTRKKKKDDGVDDMRVATILHRIFGQYLYAINHAKAAQIIESQIVRVIMFLRHLLFTYTSVSTDSEPAELLGAYDVDTIVYQLSSSLYLLLNHLLLESLRIFYLFDPEEDPVGLRDDEHRGWVHLLSYGWGDDGDDDDVLHLGIVNLRPQDFPHPSHQRQRFERLLTMTTPSHPHLSHYHSLLQGATVLGGTEPHMHIRPTFTTHTSGVSNPNPDTQIASNLALIDAMPEERRHGLEMSGRDRGTWVDPSKDFYCFTRGCAGIGHVISQRVRLMDSQRVDYYGDRILSRRQSDGTPDPATAVEYSHLDTASGTRDSLSDAYDAQAS
ncbi:zinc finger, CCHC-type containing protein, partial [Tanacetum coccineum]